MATVVNPLHQHWAGHNSLVTSLVGLAESYTSKLRVRVNEIPTSVSLLVTQCSFHRSTAGVFGLVPMQSFPP